MNEIIKVCLLSFLMSTLLITLLTATNTLWLFTVSVVILVTIYFLNFKDEDKQ